MKKINTDLGNIEEEEIEEEKEEEMLTSEE